MDTEQTALPLDNDNQKPLPRGQKLEREFAEYMKSELGFNNTELRQPIKGKIAERGYEVDIHARKDNVRMEKLMKFGVLYAILCIGLFIYNKAFGTSLLIVGFASIVMAIVANNKKATHVWVECKDHKTTVKRAQIQKLIMSVQDVKNLENSKWVPNKVMMVSGSGFDPDALHFAKEHEIECYYRTANGFEKV